MSVLKRKKGSQPNAQEGLRRNQECVVMVFTTAHCTTNIKNADIRVSLAHKCLPQTTCVRAWPNLSTYVLKQEKVGTGANQRKKPARSKGESWRLATHGSFACLRTAKADLYEQRAQVSKSREEGWLASVGQGGFPRLPVLQLLLVEDEALEGVKNRRRHHADACQRRDHQHRHAAPLPVRLRLRVHHREGDGGCKKSERSDHRRHELVRRLKTCCVHRGSGG